jgi:thiol-disulfide isomerase/thioredoxin
MRHRQLHASALIFLCTLGLVACSSAAPSSSPASSSAIVSTPAAEFSLKTLDGHDVSLGQFNGHVVVLDFWATWCGPCLERLPHVQALADDPALGSKGLVVIAIDERENAGDVRAFLAAHPADLTIALDRWGDVAGRYHVSGLPATFVIGRDGKIAAAIGAEAGDADRQLRQAVDAALQ